MIAMPVFIVITASYSPDGQRVVTASHKTARLWDAVIVTDKDTREDILLLTELAEAPPVWLWKLSARQRI